MTPKMRAIVNLLSKSADEIHEGTISPAQGQAIAAVASALIKAMDSAEFATKLEQLEKRLMEASRHAV
jgi:hypothetical protein